ncbi:MAG: cell division protein SepF, partial [Defluviitaleaceae bacterium]|nr:cell division protein SepF [Defluviitaleaceae bacterium]
MFGIFKGIGDKISNALMAPGADERSYDAEYENDTDEDYADYQEEEYSHAKSSSRKTKNAAPAHSYSRSTRDNIVGFTPSASATVQKTPAETIIKHPQSLVDAIEIGNHIRSGRMCIVELTGVQDKEAQRIVDYLYGYVAAIDGAITRVNRFNTLAVSPPAHRVMADYTDNDGGPFPDAGFLK